MTWLRPPVSAIVRATLASMLGMLAGCASAGRPGEPPPDPARFQHAPELFDVLAMEPGSVQADSLAAYEQRSGQVLTDTLADIVEDTGNHALLRANALLLIGRRHRLTDFILFPPLLDDPDERVRLALVITIGRYMAERPDAALALLRRAIHDPSAAVQARVLEIITDRDPALLRAYVAGSPAQELEQIARSLIGVAEERGAPLAAGAGGRLERTAAAGHRLSLAPVRTWNAYLVGRLELMPAGLPAVTLGDSIEVVRDVVPAFFSADGRWLVYEKGREIRVRDVTGGHDRAVGPGIAPRPLPFTDDFVYARELPNSMTSMPTGARLQYQLRRAHFATPGEPPDSILGLITATARNDVAGGASPVRWMRIIERDGAFQIVADGIEAVPLPDPFAARL